MENLTQTATARIEGFKEKIHIAQSASISEEVRDAVVKENQKKIDLILSNSKN